MKKEKSSADNSKKSFFTKKYLITVLIAAVICMTAAGIIVSKYMERADYYSEHFYEGTIINTVDCSNLTAQEASEQIRKMVEDYSLTLLGPDGNTYQIKSSDLGIKYDSEEEVAALLARQDSLKWIFEVDDAGIHTVNTDLSYNKLDLDAWIANLDFIKNGVSPEDAYEYLSDSGYWEIMPEVEGTLMDSAVIRDKIYMAVDAGETYIDLHNEDCYVQPAVRASDPSLIADVEKKNTAMQTSYKVEDLTKAVLYLYSYKEGEYYTLDSSIYRKFLVMDDSGNVDIDKDQLTDWYSGWAKERDLINNPYLFITTDHQIVIVDEGTDYGWTLDVDATVDKIYNAIHNREKDIILPVMYDYDGKAMSRSSYIEISIQQQHMWCYIDGVLKVDTPVVTGDVTKYNLSTPTDGVFHINYKQMNHHMYGPVLADGTYEYEADVTYWMPFYGAVGIHDMNRPEFGGDIYIGNGSHACVNTPFDKAEEIYGLVSAGTKVVIYG